MLFFSHFLGKKEDKNDEVIKQNGPSTNDDSDILTDEIRSFEEYHQPTFKLLEKRFPEKSRKDFEKFMSEVWRFNSWHDCQLCPEKLAELVTVLANGGTLKKPSPFWEVDWPHCPKSHFKLGQTPSY